MEDDGGVEARPRGLSPSKGSLKQPGESLQLVKNLSLPLAPSQPRGFINLIRVARSEV